MAPGDLHRLVDRSFPERRNRTPVPRFAAAAVAAAISGALIVAGPAAVPAAAADTTFTSSGTYTVPAGVTQVRIVAKGAGGGGGTTSSGGNGAMVTMLQPVTPGQVLVVTVGTGGRAAANGGTGGTGEGSGGNGAAAGGGGGGSTSVLDGTTVQIVAGGGGGGSSPNSIKYGGSGAVIDATPTQPASCNAPIANLCYPGGRGLAQSATGGAGASGDYVAGPPSTNAGGGNGSSWRSDGTTGSNGNGGAGTGTNGGGGGAGAGGGGGGAGSGGGTAAGGAGASRVSTNVSGTATYSGNGGPGGAAGVDGGAGSVIITPTNDTFTWNTPSLTLGGTTTGVVTATPASGLAVTLTSRTTSVCTVGAPATSTSTTVTAVTAGTCTIRATTAGDATYSTGLEDRSFTIAKAAQAIVGTSVPSLTYGGATGVLSASTASTSPITFTSATPSVCTVGAPSTTTSTTVTPVGAGACTIHADAAADATYEAAPQAGLLVTVAKATQTLSFTSTAPSPTAGASPYAVAASASSGLAPTFSIDSSSTGLCSIGAGNAISFGAAGSCVINADQPGDANTHPATRIQQSITIRKIAQAIRFTSTAPVATVGGPAYTPRASGGSSGNPVTFTIDSSSTGGCSVGRSNSISFTRAGSCVVRAAQAGNVNYRAASPVLQVVTVVSRPAPVVGVVSPATGWTAGGTTVTISGQGFVPGPGLSVTFGGTPATGVSWVSASTIRATAPPGQAGSVAVRVTNPDGQTATVADAFGYRAEEQQSTTDRAWPRHVANAGPTVVNDRDARTSQGTPITANVSWTGLAAADDASCLRVRKGPQRQVAVVPSGRCSLRITVIYTAPAVPGFTAYRKVVTYATRAVWR